MTVFAFGPATAGAGGVVRVGRPAVPGRRAGWLRAEVLFLGCGLALLPWAALLAALPGGRPWAVLDLAEAAALTAASVQLRQGRSPFGPAVLAGVLLVTDAGFDLATASSGSELLVALLMAVCAELPLAAACWSTAYRAGGGPVPPAAGRHRPHRGRAAASTPVGGGPTGFLMEGVSVQNIHLTARFASGIVSGPPASRLYAGMSNRLRVTAAWRGTSRPAAAAAPCPGTGPSVAPWVNGYGPPERSSGGARAAGLGGQAETRASRPGPGRTRRVASGAARTAVSGRRDPGVRRRPGPERQARFGEVRSRQSRRSAAGSRRRSPSGG